jgi:hypothetical protein
MIGLGFSVSYKRVWKKPQKFMLIPTSMKLAQKIFRKKIMRIFSNFALFPLFFAFNFFAEQILPQNQFLYRILELILLGSN